MILVIGRAGGWTYDDRRLTAMGSRKRTFTRRRGDTSQQIRLAIQIVFGAIALLVGIQFILWVRYFEHGGTTMTVGRPDGVEAWLPMRR
jgi:hypothetical protein